MILPDEIANEITKTNTCEIRTDLASRILYSTDASIYQVEPMGVVFPRTQEGLHAAVKLAAKYHIPILPRGSGTSLAGQAINEALIIDCSSWLDKILEINPETMTATVEPGVLLSNLNQLASRFGLQFGPDPASADRATMGGVISNNSTGAHSITYGMAADHIASAEVIFSDGSLGRLGEIPIQQPPTSDHKRSDRFTDFIDSLFGIREQYSKPIQEKYPTTWRNSAGYRLNYLLPWSASKPPQWDKANYPPVKQGMINTASLLAGSEGTLAVIKSLNVRLVQKPSHTVLGILSYESVAQACDSVPSLLEKSPSAIELIPRILIHLARSIPAYESQMGWVRGDPEAILVVEFGGDDRDNLINQARQLGSHMTLIENNQDQKQVWNVRKAGLGVMDARPRSERPVAFIEDCAVPVEKLGYFVREVERILEGHNVEAGMYAHASAGCLHIRPILDLKSGEGKRSLRTIAEQVATLTIRLGGAMSSEHGDGILRGEWLLKTYGEELVQAMQSLKMAADPEGLLNPRKLFDAPPMDSHLRYRNGYESKSWRTLIDFSRNGDLTTAIEQCNGQGLCRKTDGTMCPSFQATREEMHSTRGRANLLRALISQSIPDGGDVVLNNKSLSDEVMKALDLCLGCKGCKAECPSGVDMAKLKNAFYERYYQIHRRRLRDYFFGFFHISSRLFSNLRSLVHLVARYKLIMNLIVDILGITRNRPLPSTPKKFIHTIRYKDREKVIFLSDAYIHYFEPEIEQAAYDVLDLLGYDTLTLASLGAGAALLSKGFTSAARNHGKQVLRELQMLDPDNRFPILGIEPAEIYCLKHDYLDLFPNESQRLVGRTKNAFLLDEFLARSANFPVLRVVINLNEDSLDKPINYIKFHPHCHQQAERTASNSMLIGTQATVEILRKCGYEVELSSAGCCGMAGTFGFEAEHYELSMRVGELKLFPDLRATKAARKDLIVASTGSACRLQIQHGTGLPALHPIQLIRQRLLQNH